MTKSPLVSVVLPICNGEDFIVDAINSICNQSFKDFELIVIDNASVDSTPLLIKKAAKKDRRIIILTNKKNIGVVGSLNRGLKEARGVYYARMDGDDIALQTRLAEQVAFMEANPNLIALSNWGEKFGNAKGRIITPTSPAAIRATLLFVSPIVHASCIMRVSILRKYQITYRPNCPLEDFDLWIRLSEIGDLAALPRVLFRYRVHELSMTARASSYIRGAMRVVLRDSLENYLKPRGLKFILNDFTLELHSRFSCQEKMNIIQYFMLPFWLIFLVVISGNIAYPKVVLRRLMSYLKATVFGRLLSQPGTIYKTHNEIEKLAM